MVGINLLSGGIVNAQENGKYTVTVEKQGKGAVYLNNAEAEELTVKIGDKVAVKASPDEGYQVSSIKAVNEDASELQVSEEDGAYLW